MGVEEVQQQTQIRPGGARVGSVGGTIEKVELDWPPEWFGEKGGIVYNPTTHGTAFDQRLARIAQIDDSNTERGDVVNALQPVGSKVLFNAVKYLTTRVPVQVLERLRIIDSLDGDWENTKRALIGEIERLDV